MCVGAAHLPRLSLGLAIRARVALSVEPVRSRPTQLKMISSAILSLLLAAYASAQGVGTYQAGESSTLMSNVGVALRQRYAHNVN